MSNIDFTSKSLPVAGSVVSTVAPAPLAARDFGHQLRELLLQADPGNTDNITIGNEASGGDGILLEPGDFFTIGLENPGSCYHKAASGNQVLRFLGRD